MRQTRLLYPAVFLIGLCGVVAQVVVLREMVVTFYGNELCIGAMLGTWLFWTGLGSLGLGRIVKWLKRPRLWLSGSLVIGAVLLFLTIGQAQNLPDLIRGSHVATLGQIRPFALMLTSCLPLLGPFCLVNGFLFPLVCRAASEATGRQDDSVGWVYLLEAAGAAAGGMLHSFVLVDLVPPSTTAAWLAAFWCGMAWWLARGQGDSVVTLCLRLLAGGACLLAVMLAPNLEAARSSEEGAPWRPLVLIRSADSRYGRVAVVRQPVVSEQRTLYANGVLAFSYPDPPAAEGVAHLPMLQHPGPRRVLLLGGGPGVVEEILKHPSVEKLTYVELDPLAVEMVRWHFPPGAVKALRDKRVEVVLADGRAFVKGTPQRYDVALSAVGPPATAQANRFYTVEFFREIARVLEPGGVFAFHVSGGHDYIPEESRRLLACLHRSLAAAFPHVVVFSGDPVTFLASNREGVLSYRLGVLDARMAERGVMTSYADARSWEADLVGGRLEALQRVVAAPAELNRDLAPRCYYYEAQRWGAQQRAREARARPPVFDLARLLDLFDRYPFVAPLVILGLVAGLSVTVPFARRRWRDGAVAFAVVSAGLIQMGVEFCLLLGFQVVCGHLYQYIGMLVASFMLGLALGAWVSGRWVRAGSATWRRMLLVQLGICAYPLALLGFLWLSAGVRFAAMPAVAGVLFSLAALSAGFVGGLQFPLAVALHSAGAASAGPLYGLDLFGSCLGALAVSSVLVPGFGLPGVCLLLAGLAGLGLLGLLAAARQRAAQNRS